MFDQLLNLIKNPYQEEVERLRLRVASLEIEKRTMQLTLQGMQREITQLVQAEKEWKSQCLHPDCPLCLDEYAESIDKNYEFWAD